jgi:hypothetical protein
MVPNPGQRKMSEKAEQYNHQGRLPSGLLVTVGFISFSLLAHEIIVCRLLSVILSYHFVFLVLSLSLLGLGLGGLLLKTVVRPYAVAATGLGTLVGIGSQLSLAIPVSVILVVSIARVPGLGTEVIVYIPVILLPFALAGAFFAFLYEEFYRSSGRAYGADLIGGAAGAVGGIGLLDLLGAIGAPFVLGVLACASLIFVRSEDHVQNRGSRPFSVAAFFSCCCLAVAYFSGLMRLDISPTNNPGKEIHQAIHEFKGEIVETRWSSFGRTDLVGYKSLDYQMDIYLDGTAGSPMYKFGGDLDHVPPWLLALIEEFPGSFPFAHLKEGEKDTALVVGPGGGRDIIILLLAGVKEIEAVEVNKDLVEIVKGRRSFNGGIYGDLPAVKIVVGEGRSYINKKTDKYDIIYLSLPVTNTSRSLEGFSLTENYLFTEEAIEEYLAHLTDEGRLVVVTHNDAELLRLLFTSLQVLTRRGLEVSSAMSRIWVVSSGDYLVLVVKKNPFQPGDSIVALSSLLERGYIPQESFFPFLSENTGLNPLFLALARGQLPPKKAVELVAQKGYDVRPVSDESPFFFKLELGMPWPVRIVFYLASGLTIAIWILVLMTSNKSSEGSNTACVARGHTSRLGFLFFAIGTGFMTVEISVIQRLILLVANPVWATAIVIVSLLLGGGIGSVLSERMGGENPYRPIAKSCLSIGLAIVFYEMLLLPLIKTTHTWPPPTRLVTVCIAFIPLGSLMGLPFPLGIRLAGAGQHSGIIPWLWATNSAASVFGSALTIILALQSGFRSAMFLAAAWYVAAGLLFMGKGFPSNTRPGAR